MFQTLDELTKTRSRDPDLPLDEVMVDNEIKKRLAVFRQKIEASDYVEVTGPVVINEK